MPSVLSRLFALVALGLLALACGSSAATAAAKAPSPSPSCFAPGPRPSGAPGRPGAFQRPVAAGPITTLGDGSLTVHDQRSGSDVKVTYDSSVLVRVNGRAATVADLKTGEMVSIVGQDQGGGVVKATQISVRPAAGGTPGPGPRRGCPTPRPAA